MNDAQDDGRYVVVRDVHDDDYARDGRYVVVRALMMMMNKMMVVTSSYTMMNE